MAEEHVSDRAQRAADRKETGRIEAFSDGVFAIAITLLVLDLRLPSGLEVETDQELFKALFDLWPKYLAFLTSFVFIGIMWINHHRLFTHITRSNTVLLLLNLLLLLGVTAVPFPTGIVADHLGGPGASTAAMVYNGLFVAIAIFFNALWRYASGGNRLLDKDTDQSSVRRITQQYWFGPVCYLLAFWLASVNVELSLLLDLVLAAFFALPGPQLRKTPKAPAV